MFMSKSSLFVGALVLACAMAGARGASVDLTFTGVNPGLTENVSTDSGSTFAGENTGQFNFTVANKSPLGLVSSVIPGSTIATWCIELSQDTSSSSQTYSVLRSSCGRFLCRAADQRQWADGILQSILQYLLQCHTVGGIPDGYLGTGIRHQPRLALQRNLSSARQRCRRGIGQ